MFEKDEIQSEYLNIDQKLSASSHLDQCKEKSGPKLQIKI